MGEQRFSDSRTNHTQCQTVEVRLPEPWDSVQHWSSSDRSKSVSADHFNQYQYSGIFDFLTALKVALQLPPSSVCFFFACGIEAVLVHVCVALLAKVDTTLVAQRFRSEEEHFAGSAGLKVPRVPLPEPFQRRRRRKCRAVDDVTTTVGTNMALCTPFFWRVFGR